MRGRPNRASHKAKQLDFKDVFLEEQELKEKHRRPVPATAAWRDSMDDSGPIGDGSKGEDDSKQLWPLTRIEREVYPLLAKLNKEIGSALNITESTVDRKS